MILVINRKLSDLGARRQYTPDNSNPNSIIDPPRSNSSNNQVTQRKHKSNKQGTFKRN